MHLVLTFAGLENIESLPISSHNVCLVRLAAFRSMALNLENSFSTKLKSGE